MISKAHAGIAITRSSARTECDGALTGGFLYERIAGLISKEINGGLWRDGETLPSEDILTETYHVSRKTVRHALRLMERGGQIAKSQGKRSVIRCRKTERQWGRT
jgi:DNA-binding GntR family transcriptional regulator